MEELERTAAEFYSRLRTPEEGRVRMIVENLKTYLELQTGRDSLVAGVGGILRFSNPDLAGDIDLAAVGLRYTLPQKQTPISTESSETFTQSFSDNVRKKILNRHSWEHVERFTDTVQDYFDSLQRRLRMEFVQSQELLGFDRRGSGPYAQSDRKRVFGYIEDPSATLETDTERFGWYNSKGLRVCFKNTRPIDIQFVFNKTPEGWREDQGELKECPTKSGRDISPDFPYAVL
ncbi:MAG: hypothetical protein Q8P81_03890 [Nanoarchaeota archaeon]|nr:hypothetical protein [Nanoarchaeota archaeon]